jgi:hypothetical protein
VVAEVALGEEHGQHLDGKIVQDANRVQESFVTFPKGDDGDLAYAEMHEMQPPSGRDVWSRTFMKRVMLASSDVVMNTRSRQAACRESPSDGTSALNATLGLVGVRRAVGCLSS